MKIVDLWSDDFLAAEFPKVKQQLSYVARGVSVQKLFLRRKSTQSLRFFKCLQVAIIVVSGIATFLVGMDVPKYPLIFTTLTLILTSMAALFDPKSHHLRREKASLELAELQDEITYEVSKDIDSRSQDDNSQKIDEKLVDNWHKRLTAILRELHEEKMAIVDGDKKE